MNDITLDYTNVMADAVGKKNGLLPENFDALQKRADKIHRSLLKRRKSGDKPFYDLPYKIDEARALVRAANGIKKKFTDLVVLGIGGSALGTTALLTALTHPESHRLPASKRGGVKVHVADNIDPEQFGALLSTLKLKRTVFNVVSKSGSTAETMSQFMIVIDLLQSKLGKDWRKHLVLTTDAKSGLLRKLADQHKLKSFIVPEGVGGRFTVLTPVCMLPAAAAGVDVIGLLEGAARMDERCRSASLGKNPAYLFSAIHYLLDTTKGKRMSVMMPYSYRLKDIADWYRQMWAESLGKRVDVDGNEVFTGQTPIKALGATDQHSQVQLYVEGPFDKVVCFLETQTFEKDVAIPNVFTDMPGASYLGGHTLGGLLATEKEGTEYALTTNSRPNMTITLPTINAHSIGQLLYMLEVSTAFSGGLYNIDAFDQPGVEFGKEYAYAMMGKSGFENKRTEIENQTLKAKRKTL